MNALLLLWLALPPQGAPAEDERGDLTREYKHVVQPFVEAYCLRCHGPDKPKAKFDLSPYDSLESVAAGMGHWEIVLDRLRKGEMPPEKSKKQPDADVRDRVVAWIGRLRRHEAARNAGDPGPVLARRLSAAEYDYSIRDLTGVDIRPTHDFPVDPATPEGFDNSGESLTMSPALLNKYLTAARRVADHLVFLPDGLDFAPHPVVVYSDRDKYSVHRIVDFYREQPVDLAGYFVAAWRHRHRPDASLDRIAKAEGVSARYLKLVWALLTGTDDDAGPIRELRERWKRIPDSAEPEVAGKLGDWVAARRKEYSHEVGTYRAFKPLNRSAQPMVLWQNRQVAARRRLGKLPEDDGTPGAAALRKAIARFCAVFPDAFFVSERGRMFLPPKDRNKGRHLSAGFHLMVGYFRDDAPLYALILDRARQKELDALWEELDFITRTPIRQFSDYIYFERAENPKFLTAPEFDFAREDADITSPPKMRKLAKLYLAKARSAGLAENVLEVIQGYFEEMADRIRRLERQLEVAEPAHLRGLFSLAERAWQRPLTDADRTDLEAFYRSLREKQELSHEDAVRDALVSVLMSPRFFYRTTAADPGSEATPLTDLELASRLSYFLWSSLPDAELLKRAAAGTLHEPEILLGQTKRMVRDGRVRRLAVEFGANWFDVRRFEAHNGVNRDRFPVFTDDLRRAMFEEPVRFTTDLIRRNGSVLEFLEARHTFVNRVLARHYGLPIPEGDKDRWVRVDDADRVGRGGLLPMAVFLTKNSPGLRTSPVKRGYWVVRKLLGEHIPAPPPEVPELPEDEAELGELSLRDVLAKHREIRSCAVCHDRFDSIGLVFEGYGPVGERRDKDLGGRPVDTKAEFPDGSAGEGLAGLKRYLREVRRAEFVDTLCRKLLSYALGRSLLLSDDSTIALMKERLAGSGHRFGSLVETIVTSPQFLRKRGRDHPTGR